MGLPKGVTLAAAFAMGIGAATAPCTTNAEQKFPSKPIRVIVGFPPGSPADIVARLLGQQLTEVWEKPMVVHNISGATGSIATDRLAKATSDGYTLGLLNQPQIIISPSLQRLPFDPIKDLAPVSQVAASLYVLIAHSAVPATTVQELIKLAKARPGEMTFATAGSGSAAHMAGELFKSSARLDIRPVPYKGLMLAVPDLLAGRVTMTFGPVASFLPLAREGKLRALAVTSLRRSAQALELPTIAESGYPGFEVTNWYGLLGPAKTPAAIVGKIHRESVKALARPDLRAKLGALGLEAIGNAPDEFAAVIKSEIPRWAKLIKEAGIKPE